MIQILPAILSKRVEDYLRKIKAVEKLVDEVQIDIVDNKFARNQTVKPKDIASIRTPLRFEIQLMVEFLEDWIDPFIKLRPTRIVVPFESVRDPIGIINHLRQHQVEIGFSLNPETGAEKMQHLIDKVDTVLVLSVHPGFSGQHFVHTSLNKIRKLREMRNDITIEVDGAVQPGIARKLAETGANILASGSFIFAGEAIPGETYEQRVANAYQALVDDVADVVPDTAG
ncbi:MAG: hypothetical protein Q8P13_04630 [bacterium]|nr:hypothetical protein [bacterium]